MDERGDLNRAGRRALARQERRGGSSARKAALSGGAVLTLGASFVASAPVAQAATFTVTTLDDTDDPDQEGGGDAAETTLREAIVAANTATGPDIITFESGLTGTIQLTQGQLYVTDSLTIEEPDAYINVQAEAGYRVFYLGDGGGDPIDVRIEGISISGGSPAAGDGGNVLATNLDLTLDGVTVQNGTSPAAGGGIAFRGGDDGVLSLVDTTVTGNTSETRGGGIAVYDTYGVVVTDSDITDNDSRYGDGGGIAVYGVGDGDVLVTGSTISNNLAGYDPPYVPNEGDPPRAVVDGGGLSATYAEVSIATTSIVNNDASGNGGGVFTDRANALTITDSTIAFNYAGDDGGGVHVEISGDGGTTITASSISGNTAGGGGGGVYVNDGYGATITGSTINGNTAQNDDGGGVSLYDVYGDITVSSSTISGNSASGSGGGLAVDDDSSFSGEDADFLLSGSTVSNNSSSGEGGGVAVRDFDGDVTVDATSITGNTSSGNGGGGAAGGLLVTGADYGGEEVVVSILNSDVSNNEAKYEAGGIGITQIVGDVTVSNTTVTGNDAFVVAGLGIEQITGYDGGESEVAILNSAFTGNTAKYAVGGFGISGATANVVVSGVTVDANEAGKYPIVGPFGGFAIVDTSGDLLIENTAVTNNSAFGRAGGFGLDSVGGTTTITGTTVTGNTVETQDTQKYNNEPEPGIGGGLHLADMGVVNITESLFESNYAEYGGGGIAVTFYAYGGVRPTAIDGLDSLTISATVVSNNSAGRNGGGLWFSPDAGEPPPNDAATALVDPEPGVVLVESTVSGNHAGGDGGGLFVRGGEDGGGGDLRADPYAPYAAYATFTIERSTINDNLADDDGGGVAFENLGGFDVVNSTISGNAAGGSGGGLSVTRSFGYTRHSTIVENVAAYDGGGVQVYEGGTFLDHTIVGDNSASYGADLAGPGVVAARFSLIESDPNDPVDDFEDFGDNIIGEDPQLGPLADNGGPTLTHHPLPGSPVIDAGDPEFEPPPATDQRGLFREVNIIDIGSVEVQAVSGGGGGGGVSTGTIQFSTSSVSVSESGGTATVTITRSSNTGSASVTVQSAPGTATSPADFGAVNTVVTFAAGETSKTFTVPIVDDFAQESSETFTLTLSNPVGAALGTPATVTVTITDDADLCTTSTTSFQDVPPSNVHAASIACAQELGLTVGTSPTTYSPEAPVSRAQMASFIANVLDLVGFALPQNPPDAFDDDNGSVHDLAINQLAALGVIQGTGPRAYNPSGNVSRGQMARFLVGAYEVATSTDATATSDHFSDDNGTTFENDINTGFELGLFVGTSATTYTPSIDVRRDQMATFLVRLVDALAEAGKPPVS
jgi:hypothetical protein